MMKGSGDSMSQHWVLTDTWATSHQLSKYVCNDRNNCGRKSCYPSKRLATRQTESKRLSDGPDCDMADSAALVPQRPAGALQRGLGGSCGT